MADGCPRDTSRTPSSNRVAIDLIFLRTNTIFEVVKAAKYPRHALRMPPHTTRA